MHSLAKSLAQLQDEVDELVRKYISMTTLTPTVVELVKTPGYMDLFTQVFSHHISLVKSRSQAFEDGHITVYDKALLVLTRNGKNLHDMGAIELFKDEVLGIRKKQDIEAIEAMLGKNLALRAILSSATYQKQLEDETDPASQPIEEARAIATPGPSEGREGSKSIASSPKESTKQLIDRMLKIFSAAQSEYHFVSDGDREEKFKAAKFLRDSAENTLKYLIENDPRHFMVPILRSEFEMARRKAVELNGGKKRPFEVEREYRPRPRRALEHESRRVRGAWDTYRPQ